MSEMSLYFAVFIVTYLATGLYTSFDDITSKNAQRNRAFFRQFIRASRRIFFNIFVVSSLHFMLFDRMFSHTSSFILQAEGLRLTLAFCLLDLSRFLSHSLFHTETFFTLFHHVNHEFYLPRPFLFANAHPIDWYVNFLLPATLPILAVQTHYVTTLFWIAFVTFFSMTENRLQRAPHHVFPQFNLSIGIFADRLFQTELSSF
jgi:hypothetical protein